MPSTSATALRSSIINLPKSCPKCPAIAATVELVERLFGYRTMDGVKRPQSQCKDCRSGKTVDSVKHVQLPRAFNVLDAIDEAVKEKKVKAQKPKKAPVPSPVKNVTWEEQQELFRQADALGELTNRAYAHARASRAGDSTTASEVIEITEAWTQCDSCVVRFTRDPEAAGWKKNGHRMNSGSEYICQACDFEDAHAVDFWIKKDKIDIRLGHGDYKKTLGSKTVAELLKDAVSKEEKAFWQRVTKELGRDCLGCSWSINEGALFPTFAKLLNFKEPPAPATTVKI